MDNQEEILDSGEIYKDPENERLALPNIKLDLGDQINPEQTPMLGRLKHYFAGNYTYEKVMLLEGEMITFKSIDNILTIAFISVLLLNFFNLKVAIFFIVILVLRYLLRPIAIFNKISGTYKKKAKIPLHRLFYKRDRMVVKLKEIKAIQLLVKSYAYEVNIVLADNSRLNILLNNDRIKLEKEASELAEFLGVPVIM